MSHDGTEQLCEILQNILKFCKEFNKQKHESYSGVCSTLIFRYIPDQNDIFKIYITSMFWVFCVAYFQLGVRNQYIFKITLITFNTL